MSTLCNSRVKIKFFVNHLVGVWNPCAVPHFHICLCVALMNKTIMFSLVDNNRKTLFSGIMLLGLVAGCISLLQFVYSDDYDADFAVVKGSKET
ncbi:CLUMA_CG011268, isoform A [Clunio marinus]|uniref:CLUMA_CG011268, isoform A n=1 Tax=Clunio marinus TaxID=568069 RepID=A0A1J1IC80_9DIPT|nr:CLUMA_CG011268, isoform A [Clunio marinus]